MVSILTFLRSRISKMFKKFMWPWRLTLELKVTHIHCMTFLISACIHAADWILVSILIYTMSRISKMKVKQRSRPYLFVNIIQTSSLYQFWHFRGLGYGKCWNNFCISNVWPWSSRSYTFFIRPCLSQSVCMLLTQSWLVSILTFTMSSISENPKSVPGPWWLTLIFKVKQFFNVLLSRPCDLF